MVEIQQPTQLLIQSNRVDAIAVKTRDGDRLGHVFAFMISKRSGQSMYAVLTIGGFLGMGKAYYPLPFSLLSFDPAADTYVVTIDRRMLEGGPSWANSAPVFDQAYANRVSSYYDTTAEDLSVDGIVAVAPPIG